MRRFKAISLFIIGVLLLTAVYSAQRGGPPETHDVRIEVASIEN